MTRPAIYFMLLLIVSCQSVPVYDENSRFYEVPDGSNLILNRPVSIEPNLARAYFQYGKQLSKRDIDKYQPHCYLLLSTLSQQEQIVQPDSFIIYQVERDAIASTGAQHYASLGLSLFHTFIVEYVNIYHLRSPRQPHVMSLNCLQWAASNDRLYLTVKEVRQALGDVFSLQLTDMNH